MQSSLVLRGQPLPRNPDPSGSTHLAIPPSRHPAALQMLQETHMLVDFLKAASGQNLSLDGLSEEIDAMIVYHVHIMFISCSIYFIVIL